MITRQAILVHILVLSKLVIWQNLFDCEANGAEMITPVINEEPVRFDHRQHQTWVGGQEVELTTGEVFLLGRLARQPNEIVSLVEMVKARFVARQTI